MRWISLVLLFYYFQMAYSQDVCLSCILGEETESPGMQDFLRKKYDYPYQGDSKLKFVSVVQFTEIQSTNTSYFLSYGTFRSVFDHLGIKKTYKETKKSARKFIVAKGKNNKDPWLDMYDPTYDVGVKITFDKSNPYIFYRLSVYALNDQKVNRPWCNYKAFECSPDRSILKHIEENELWKLIGYELTGCDTSDIRKNTVQVKDKGYIKMDGSQLFAFTQTPFVTIQSVLVDVNLSSIELPGGVTKSSSLTDLIEIFGTPYNFDGNHFEVLLSEQSMGENARKCLATFFLNEEQNGITHFNLEYSSGYRIKPDELTYYSVKPVKGLNDKLVDGNFKNYYYCNGYSFYGVVRNHMPYEGKISNVFNKKEERYSIPDQIEAERLAKLTKEEIEQEERDKLAREEAIKKEERAVENGKKLKQYVANQEGIIKRIGLDYNKFIKSYVNACESDDLSTRGYYNKEAYNYLKQMQETINELQSEMGRFKTFISNFPISDVISGKYQELYSLSTDMLYFTYDLHRTAWTEGDGLKYGAITNTIDTVEEYFESKNNKIEDYINQARLIPNDMLVLLYEANNK